MAEPIQIDLTAGMGALRKTLSLLPVKTRVMLNGKIIVARDIAHAKLKERLDRGDGLPDYFKEHMIFYAGPAKTPEGEASGALGPTTAGRMDSYVPVFQKEGASLVMLAKGTDRSRWLIHARNTAASIWEQSAGLRQFLAATALQGPSCLSIRSLGWKQYTR